MQPVAAFLYFANKPRTGPMNLLLCSVCVLIPVLGVIILLGYKAEVGDALRRNAVREEPDGPFPDFSFNHFVRYLQRGLWPFLTLLVGGLVIAMPLMAVVVGVGAGVYFLAGREPLAGIIVGVVVYMAGFAAGYVLLWPMELRAQVTRAFDPLGDFKFAWRFLRLTGADLVFAVLIVFFVGNALYMVGSLLLVLGYPALVIQQMAQERLLAHLYAEYLEAGGDPLVPPPPPVARRVEYEDDEWADAAYDPDDRR